MNFTEYALAKYNPSHSIIRFTDLSIGELGMRISFESNRHYIDPEETRLERRRRRQLIKRLEAIKTEKWRRLFNGGR